MMNYLRVGIVLIGLVSLCHPGYGQGRPLPLGQQPQAAWQPDRLIVRLASAPFGESHTRQEHTKGLAKQQTMLMQRAGATKWQPMFPAHQPGARRATDAAGQPSRLQHLYLMEVPVGTNIPALCRALAQEPGVASAEPYYNMELLLVPTDPGARSGGQQDYLEVISAYEAWDISTGDPEVFIAVIDAGFDINHEDLADNLYTNQADPINGLDDDDDGYPDSFNGYDLADLDSDVSFGPDPHGLEVAGISSATTDNGIGLAGLGFDCRYYPLKIFRDSDNAFRRGYEAIVLAADLGADVINLSWGGQIPFSQAIQDIIDYAVLDQDVVVVAAAGNTGTEARFFPASFDHVLSVGATNDDDTRADFSSFGRYIDIMAPGRDIYSTVAGGGYGNVGGTSFAAPMVAATAALLRSAEPELSAIEVMERIRTSADDIYSVGANSNYQYQLGKGRLNMEAALLNSTSPSIRLQQLDFNSSFGNLVFSNDTVSLNLGFVNHLADAGLTSITLRALNPSVTLLDSLISLPSLASGSSSMVSEPLRFFLGPDVAPGTQLEFLLLYEGSSYSDFEYFDVPVVPHWLNFPGGALSLTTSSAGNLGYERDSLTNGIGLRLGEETLLHLAGFGVALDSQHVADNMPLSLDSLTYDTAFVIEESIRLYQNSLADHDARSSFYDVSTNASGPLGITVEQKVLSWQGAGDWLIVEYRLINTGADTLAQPAVGLFADWSIGEGTDNRMNTDASRKLSYAWSSSSPGRYAGLSLLSEPEVIINALAVDSTGQRSFDDARKHTYLSGLQQQASAGLSGSGTDVAAFISTRLDDVPFGESRKVAFAWLGGTDLAGLQANHDAAWAHYQQYLAAPPALRPAQVCAGQGATVNPAEGDVYAFYSDPAGQDLLITDTALQTAVLTADTVFYVSNLDGLYPADIRSLPVALIDGATEISASQDTLYLGDQPVNSIRFETTNPAVQGWDWQFDNGFASSAANPAIVFDAPGSYTARVYTVTSLGCRDTSTLTVQVLERPAAPLVRDTLLCAGSDLAIDPPNADFIRVYADALQSQIVFEGLRYELSNITTAQTLYLSTVNAQGVESQLSPLRITISMPVAAISASPDTLDLSSTNLLYLSSGLDNARNLSWDLGNGSQGSLDPQPVSYTAGTYEVRLTATDSLGCPGTSTLTLEVGAGVAPAPIDTTLCRGSAWQRHAEAVYHFYNTAGDQLLHKGRMLSLIDLQADTSFLVASMAGLSESARSRYDIRVDPFAPLISLSTDTLLLGAEAQSVRALVDTVGLRNWIWQVDDLIYGQVNPLVIDYALPGSYTYQLSSESTRGCTDTSQVTLEVSVISNRPTAIITDWQVWPNPARQEVNIQAPAAWLGEGEARLTDLSGKLLKQGRLSAAAPTVQWEVSNLTPGVYLLLLPGSKPMRLLIAD